MKQPQTTLQKQMSRLIKEWEESGLPLKTYSNSIDVSYYKLKYWKYKFDKLKQEKSVSDKIEKDILVSSSPDVQDFIPVEVSVAENSQGIELIFPNGVKLRCSQGIKSEELKTLIKLF
jgi:hypothetical protein